MEVAEERIIVGDGGEDEDVDVDEVEVQNVVVVTDVDEHGYVDADDDASQFAVRMLQEVVQQHLLPSAQAHPQMMPEIYYPVHVLTNRQKDLKMKKDKINNKLIVKK